MQYEINKDKMEAGEGKPFTPEKVVIGIDLSSTVVGGSVFSLETKKILRSGAVRLPVGRLESYPLIKDALFKIIFEDAIGLMIGAWDISIVIEISDFRDPSTTIRFYRMLGGIELKCGELNLPVKAITPQEGRRFYLDIAYPKGRDMHRKELKEISIKLAKDIAGITCETDDEAEAILISIVGQKARHMDLVKQNIVISKAGYKKRMNKKKNARNIVKKVEAKAKGRRKTDAEKTKIIKYKEIAKKA